MAQSASQVRHEIEELCISLYEHKLSVAIYPPIIQDLGAHRLVISPRQRDAAALIPQSDFTTLSEYRQILRHQLYTCLLNDAAVLQLSYTFDHETLVGHRLCYYACPVRLDVETFEPEDDLIAGIDL